MAARAIWKGTIRLAELAFPVALYAAATTSQRVSFHILNRATGHRVEREYVDEETGKPVEKEDQVKGYETAPGDYIVVTPEEIAGAVPESDKTLTIEAFIPCPEVESVYFDKPYFIAPSDGAFSEPFAIVREGMRRKKVAALARAVLFRRVRTVMLRVQEHGLVAHTLNFDYEVRSAEDAFGGLPDVEVGGEMLDLARHIIDTKRGEFDPRSFDDRYDAALAELVKAKIEGREIRAPKRPRETKVTNLMDALRESAKVAGGAKPPARRKKKAPAEGRKADGAARRKTG
jgi:DNA end-binding protein Ku